MKQLALVSLRQLQPSGAEVLGGKHVKPGLTRERQQRLRLVSGSVHADRWRRLPRCSLERPVDSRGGPPPG